MEEKILKTERLGIRISPKLRYGLSLLSNKYRVSESEMVSRAIELLLVKEGLDAVFDVKDGKVITLIDLLFSKPEPERNIVLAEYAPELATKEQIILGKVGGYMRSVVSAQDEFDLIERIKKFNITADDISAIHINARSADMALINPRLSKFKTTTEFVEWVKEELRKDI